MIAQGRVPQQLPPSISTSKNPASASQVWNQVFSLPENFKIFPAHDYQGLYFISIFGGKW